MKTIVKIVDGKLVAIHSDRLEDLVKTMGTVIKRRASYVELTEDLLPKVADRYRWAGIDVYAYPQQWWAYVFMPREGLLGPFSRRDDALAAEVQFIEEAICRKSELLSKTARSDLSASVFPATTAKSP